MKRFYLEDLMHIVIALGLVWFLTGCGAVPDDATKSAALVPTTPVVTPYYVGTWDYAQSISGACASSPQTTYNGFSILGGTYVINAFDDITLAFVNPIHFVLVGNTLYGDSGHNFTWTKVDDVTVDITYQANCVARFTKR